MLAATEGATVPLNRMDLSLSNSFVNGKVGCERLALVCVESRLSHSSSSLACCSNDNDAFEVSSSQSSSPLSSSSSLSSSSLSSVPVSSAAFSISIGASFCCCVVVDIILRCASYFTLCSSVLASICALNAVSLCRELTSWRRCLCNTCSSDDSCCSSVWTCFLDWDDFIKCTNWVDLRLCTVLHCMACLPNECEEYHWPQSHCLKFFCFGGIVMHKDDDIIP